MVHFLHEDGRERYGLYNAGLPGGFWNAYKTNGSDLLL